MSILYHPESDCYYTGILTEADIRQGCHEVEPIAGMRVPAGPGHAVVMPDLDFESYSEAGYYWDGPANRWRGVTKTNPGLLAVGAPVYSEHPSCEVLSLAYDLKDGRKARLWVPGMKPPQELFDHIMRGGLLEAWNSAFEFYIWKNVCNARMGWPELPVHQLRDAMAKARAWSIPGALKNTAKVLNAPEQKDKAGETLLRKLSIPRTPTKKDDRLRRTPADEPLLFGQLYDYNIQDIRAEAAVSLMTPDLSQDELELWLLDQKINTEGVHIDREALDNCITIINQAQGQYNKELQEITGGAIQAASEIQKLQKWMQAQGVTMGSLDKAHVAAALHKDDPYRLPPQCRRALEIRSSIGAASVKKLFSLDRRTSRDSRIRDLFAFCGADRTGRFAGRGPQPQNLPNSGPAVRKCEQCDNVYWKGLNNCPGCGADHAFSAEAEWGIEAAESALNAISTRDLAYVESLWGDATAAVAGCLRGLFSAAPGHDLICSDFSAIEAVVLAFMAGEQWRMEVFRTHGKIYEMSAAKITSIPFEQMMQHKKDTGNHHPMRKKIGKVAELACFTPNTQVLTDRGYVSIEAVKKSDKLWDGAEWVNHDGIINKGKRDVIKLDGIGVTPNHPINLGRSWKEARLLASNKNTLIRALVIGSENLPLFAPKSGISNAGQLFSAHAARQNTLSHSLISSEANPLVVENAAVRKPEKLTLKNILNMPISFLTRSIDDALSIGYVPQLDDATIQEIKDIKTTAVGGSQYVMNGEKMQASSSPMCSHWKAGTSRLWKWIDEIRIKDTSRAILDLFHDNKTCSTNDQSLKCRPESMNSSVVYDIVNAGPRNRFTIKTDSGHLIVHNSGYAGWIGAWKNFGADKFMDDDEIKQNILAWREASPAIVEFWGGQWRKDPNRWHFEPELYGIEGAAISAVMNPGQCFAYRDITYGVKDDVLYCRLPSGRLLNYHHPRLIQGTAPHGNPIWNLTYEGWNSDYTKGPTGWMRLDTYGGKLTENIVQAVARDILTHAMVNLDKAGYPIVLHIHDEVVSEVPEGSGDVGHFEQIMGTMPSWCADWPVKAAGGWRGKRYRKD